MKNKLALVCAVVLLAGFTSCSAPVGDETTNDLVFSAIDAIETGNEAEFEDLFVPLALERSSVPIEEIFDELEDYYEGELQSWSCTQVDTKEYHGSNFPVDKMVTCTYRITTSEEVYTVTAVRYELEDGSGGLASFNLATAGQGL